MPEQSNQIHSKFSEDAEERYEVYFDYQNFEEYKDEMLRFDQSRRPRFEKLEALMRSRFQELGKSTDQGSFLSADAGPLFSCCVKKMKDFT